LYIEIINANARHAAATLQGSQALPRMNGARGGGESTGAADAVVVVESVSSANARSVAD
jgi:hypothetical protein